ncbi:hypothetical protein HYDPIDRAFT_34944 [Hydnomerulius pinastri MD-312]|uniref:Uncharacterized protein n=1 Tax=Hydnomerulius pinastri MD-312 TaxID=994086 RepID=A0A0C9VJK6_9AGAM|nr:hypothetical protein HYDPIDRAFT_34944 [Hydnomerulius pinastri MD-312]
MLRPFGEGKYPGVSSEDDPSELPKTLTSVIEPPSVISSAYAAPPPSEPVFGAEGLQHKLQPSSAVYEVTDDSPTSLSMIPVSPFPATVANEVIGGCNLKLEDVLEEPDSELELSSSLRVSELPSPWIHHKGKRIHKASLCRVVITPNWSQKSHE